MYTHIQINVNIYPRIFLSLSPVKQLHFSVLILAQKLRTARGTLTRKKGDKHIATAKKEKHEFYFQHTGSFIHGFTWYNLRVGGWYLRHLRAYFCLLSRQNDVPDLFFN